MCDDDAAIWRYMDLAKYVGLLSRGLFFSQPQTFGDPWEGSWGEGDVKEFRESNRGAASEVQALWDSKYDSKKAALARIGVSSWHLSDTESAALWDLYIPKKLGVAITSTPARVVNSLAADGRRVVPRTVQYSDLKGLTLGDDPVDLLSHKRQEYKHEKELRFIIDIRDDERQAIRTLEDALSECTSRHVHAARIAPLVRRLGSVVSRDKTVTTRAAPGGVHLATDVSALVDRVILAPSASYPLRRAVLDATQQFGLDRKKVVEPEFDQIPFDILRFHDP